MGEWQVWLVSVLDSAPRVAALMRTAWMWPLAESLHFIGLSMLVGSVLLFDLRLLGLAPGIPIRAMHRLIPWGLAGFALNACTGLLFLLTDGGQYIYNPSFMFKVAFIAAAGVNALLFYVTVGRRVVVDTPGAPPLAARLFAAVSLTLWLGVIVAGRLLTFYRPFDCAPGEAAAGTVILCVPGRD